jgi:hypothetical protein
MSNVPAGPQENNPQEQSRTTKDLIDEMVAEAEKFNFGVLLAVGFEASTVFIRNDDDERLNKLNEAVGAGGEPVGLIGITRDGDSLTVFSRLLAEHAGEEWATTYMEALLGASKIALELGQEVRRQTGWIS